MVLFSMDYPTIFKQIYDESEKVEFYLKKNIKKVFLGKQGRYISPNIHYDIVTMPNTHNQYLLYWNIPDPEAFYFGNCALKEKNSLSGSALLLKDNEGKQHAITYKRYKTFVNKQLFWTDGLHTFTPHFFSRYRERMDIESRASINDVIAAFCARNLNYFVEVDYNEMILPKDRKENGALYAIKDGIMIVERTWPEVDGRKILLEEVKTFLSGHNLKIDQTDHVPSKEDICNYAREVFKKYNGYDFEDL